MAYNAFLCLQGHNLNRKFFERSLGIANFMMFILQKSDSSMEYTD
jgi:hypothetical protein